MNDLGEGKFEFFPNGKDDSGGWFYYNEKELSMLGCGSVRLGGVLVEAAFLLRRLTNKNEGIGIHERPFEKYLSQEAPKSS